MVSMSRHHILFDIASDDQLDRALSALAVRHRLAFSAVRAMTPRAGHRQDADERDDHVPVWRWGGTLRELEECAQELLNELVYPLARCRRGACLVFPFPSSGLAPRTLRVEQRSSLDLEDIAALFATADAVADRSAPEIDTERRAAALEGLDPDQRAAALHGRGPARVLAAAGSGKTKTMVARIGSLVASGVRPQAILVLAFNTEAAVQLEERLAAAGVPTTRCIGPTADGVHCATFNAFGHRFQRQVLGDAPAVALSEAEHDRLLRAALGPAAAEPAAPSLEARRRRSPARSAAADPYDAAATDAAWALSRSLTAWRAELTTPPPEHREALRRHASIQTARGVQAFDDQILAAVTALLAEPAHRRLVQGLYEHVLVDEFQDVNPTQAALLDIIGRPWRDLFVVGDDDQLIYGWRSADVSTIVDFGVGLPAAPYIAYYTLPTNYRCSREVVRRAEQLVTNNRRRAQKSMQARPAAPPGAVCFAAGGRPEDRFLEVAAFLAAEQARLDCPWHELAVLCRFRSQLTTVAAALRDTGVPARAPAAAGLDAEHSRRLDCALRDAAADPVRAGSPAMPALESVLDHLSGSGDATTGDEPRAGTTTGDHRDAGLTTRPPYADGMPHRPPGASPRQEDGAAPLQVADAARLLACRHTTLAGLAAAWHALAEPDPAARGRCCDGVTLATIHATKGREYRSVAIVDFAPALAPLKDAEREEERRVLYVALTRARERTLLTVDSARGGPHPFIVEAACPPQRRDVRPLKREAAALREGLLARAAELPGPVAHLITGSGAVPRVVGGRSGPSRETGGMAADYLAVRSRIAESQLVIGHGLRERLAAWLG
jgi:DNA helicase-2/ATP-dependent DNA helicase PcrA